jgi:chaperonin GroES
MNVRPLHDRIIARRLEDSDQTVGSIIIPDSAKEKPQQGIVIAAGLGKTNEHGTRVPVEVRAGDQILFGKYAGQEIRLDGDDFLIVKEEEVLAVIDNQPSHTRGGAVSRTGKEPGVLVGKAPKKPAVRKGKAPKKPAARTSKARKKPAARTSKARKKPAVRKGKTTPRRR